MMADLKSRIGGRKLFSNLVWKREDQLGHSGQHKRATSVNYNSRRDENAPVDYDSDASSIASDIGQGEEAYFLPGGEGGEAPTTPSRKGQSAEPTSLLKRIDLPVFPASSPTRCAYGAEESPKRLIERIGNGLFAAQHPPMTLGSEDMEIDSTPGQGNHIAEEAPNGHVWTDQAVHEAGAMSGINSLAIDKVHHEAGSGTIQSASTTSLNNRFEQSNDHHQATNEGLTTHKDIETIPGLTLSEQLDHLTPPVQHRNAEASSSSISSTLPVPATEGGSHEKTTNSVMIPQTPPRTSTRKSPPSSFEEGQWEDVNASSQMPPDFIENVRKLLLPLITQNAQRRTDFGQETIQSPESVQKALSGVVDDGACTSFAGQMSVVRREMIALKPETVKEAVIPATADRSQVAREDLSSMPSQPLPSEKNGRATPWAPRAMREVSLPTKRDELYKPPPTKTSSYIDNSNAEGKSKAEVPTANGSDYQEQLKSRDKVDETSKYPQLKEIRDRRGGYESRRSSARAYTPLPYRRDSLDSRGETRRTSDRDYARKPYRKDSLDLQVEARRPSVRDFASNHRRTDSLENPPAPLRTPIRSSFKDWGNRIDSNLSSDGIDRTKRPYPPSDRRTSHSSTTATRRSPSRSPPRRRSRSPRYSRSHTRQDKVHSPPPRRYSPAPPHSAQTQEFTSHRPRSPARNGRSPSPAENILLQIRRGRSRSRSPISRYKKGLSPTRKDHFTSRRRSPYYGRGPSPGALPRRSARKSYSPIRRSKSPPMRRRTPTDQRLDKTPRESRSPIRRRHHSPYALMEIDLRSPSPSRSRSISRGHSLPTKQHRLPKPRPASTINGPEYDLPKSAYDELEKERKPKINHLNETAPIHPRPTTPALSNPCHNVPGLWFVKMGSKTTDILECYFEVDKETAVKWGIPEVSSSLEKRAMPSHMDKPRLSLQILCLPTDLVQSVTAKLPPDASAEVVANALSTIKGSWPPTGNLIIEVNPGTPHAHTWLPYNLQPASPPVTLENYIHEGTNVVQLIQLAGMADHIFVLYAFLQQPDPPPLLKFPHDLDKSLAHTKFKLGDVGSIPLLVTSVSIVPLDSISPNS